MMLHRNHPYELSCIVYKARWIVGLLIIAAISILLFQGLGYSGEVRTAGDLLKKTGSKFSFIYFVFFGAGLLFLFGGALFSQKGIITLKGKPKLFITFLMLTVVFFGLSFASIGSSSVTKDESMFARIHNLDPKNSFWATASAENFKNIYDSSKSKISESEKLRAITMGEKTADSDFAYYGPISEFEGLGWVRQVGELVCLFDTSDAKLPAKECVKIKASAYSYDNSATVTISKNMSQSKQIGLTVLALITGFVVLPIRSRA